MSSIPTTTVPTGLPARITAVLAEEVTRADVRVTRKGWIEHKAHDHSIGLLMPGENTSGRSLWRAQVGDDSTWAFSRNDAITAAINLYNQQQRSDAYRRLVWSLGRYNLTEKD